ncbi:MAG: rRNA maturation RNase YbeY [Desulfobacterales bacterium]|jgi:probable rRNA maturation factor|nr:rRNA maturation RNase YbeY [Desulfobacterales bacterium]
MTAQALLNALGSPEGELSIAIMDDPQIQALNQQYLNRPWPTNVIAFPMRNGIFSDINPDLLGDVAISVDTAAREAKDLGVEFEERFNFLLIHGILHLFGYDHETGGDDERAMDEKTEELFEVIKKLVNPGARSQKPE